MDINVVLQINLKASIDKD